MSEQAKTYRPQRVPPPIPAPYLAGAPQLPDELLTSERSQDLSPEDQARTTGMLRKIKRELFERRRAHEEVHGIEIVPEPPLLP